MGCFRCLSIERIFSKAEIWSQELQFNYKFLTNATKQAFSMPTKCRASFSRPFSDYYDVLFTKLLAMLRNGLFHRLPGTSVTRSPVITKTGWLKCQWCGASPPPDDSPLLGKSRTNMGDLNLLTQLSTCFVLFCDWRIGTHQFSLHTLCS